ncbi:unnamed protein product [Cochlearia groenlandica]
MKLSKVTFLLCAITILLFLNPTSSLQVNTHYTTSSQGLSEKIVTKILSRKLLIISSEHENVRVSTFREGSSEQLQVTSSEKTKNEEKKIGEKEEENALSKYLSMDYPRFRRRRPVHNKSLPLRP